MLIHKERLTGSTASTSLILTTTKFSGVRLVNIYVNPATASTTYDLLIEDSSGDDIFEELGIQGQLNRTVRIATFGSHTITISNASADEVFVVKLGLEE